MKGTAKMSLEAYCVLDPENDREQWVVNFKVKSKVLSTLTFFGEPDADQIERFGNWLAHMMVSQIDKQRAFHFTDDIWGIQEELPF